MKGEKRNNLLGLFRMFKIKGIYEYFTRILLASVLFVFKKKVSFLGIFSVMSTDVLVHI